MKRKHFGLIALVSLATVLAACQNQNSSSSTPNPSSPSISSRVSSSTPSSSKPITSSSSLPASDSSSSSSAEDPEEGLTQDEKLWKANEPNAYQLMLLHLNNQVIPYFDFGNHAMEWVYDTGTSSVVDEYGGLVKETEIEYNSANLQTLDALFPSASGWVKDDSKSSYQVLYTNSTSHLIVKLIDDSGFISLHIVYDEPYDASSATGWDASIMNAIHTNIPDFHIPFLYLGTSHNYSEYEGDATTSDLGTLYGGKWNDKVIDDAKTTFENTNASLSAQDANAPLWDVTITEASRFNDKRSLRASIANVSGDQLILTLSGGGTSETGNIKLSFRIVKKYDTSAYTNWSQDVLDAMEKNLDGHIVPYFSLGTNDPRPAFTGFSNTLYLYGSYYSEDGIEAMKKALEADVPTEENKAKGETSWAFTTDNLPDSFVAQGLKTFADGCDLKAMLRKTGSGDAVNFELDITIDRRIDAGKLTAYSASTKKVLDTYLDGHEVPYIYLNLNDFDGADERTTFTPSSHLVRIEGGRYTDKLYDAVKKQFKDASWDIASDEKANSTLKASKTFPDGDKIVATFHKADSSMYVNSVLDFKLDEKFDTSASCSYQADTVSAYQKNISKNLVLPYLYLGTKMDTTSYDDFRRNLYIYGNTWDNSLIDNFNTAFDSKGKAESGWTWSIGDTEALDDGTEVYSALGVYTDLSTVEVTLNRQENGVPVMSLSYHEKYDSSSFTAWPKEVKDAFTSSFGKDVEVPLVYLGTDNVKVTSSDTNTVTLEGAVFRDEMFTDMKTSLAGEGYQFQEYSTRNYRALAASSMGDGTTSSFRFYMTKGGSSKNSPVQLEIDYSPKLDSATNAANLNTMTDWDNNTKAAMKKYLQGHTIRYFAIPDAPSYVSGAYYSDPYDMSLTTFNLSESTKTAFSFNYFLLAKQQILKESGNSAEVYLSASSDSGKPGLLARVKAYDADGKEDGFVDLSYSSNGNYDYSIYLTYVAPFVAPTGEDAIWKASDVTKMKNAFDGNAVPYVYLGTGKPSVNYSYSDSYMTITGDSWDDSIYTEAEAAFKASDGWSYVYNTVSYPTKAFLASKDFGSGECKKTMTVVLYDNYNSTYNCHMPTMLVYYR